MNPQAAYEPKDSLQKADKWQGSHIKFKEEYIMVVQHNITAMNQCQLVKY